MKAAREHRIPLSNPAPQLLERMRHLMDSRARYCDTHVQERGNVIPISGRVMRRKRQSKEVEDKLAQYAAEVNAADKPGRAPEDRLSAAESDNQRVLDWLAEKREQNDPQWMGTPTRRDRFVIAIIREFEQYYNQTKNPAFAWYARHLVHDLVPQLATAPTLRWMDDYLDTAAGRIAELIHDPPRTEVNDHLARALGFEPGAGRGRGSAFSKAHRVMRDANLALDVFARLPFERDKETQAIAYVAGKTGLSRTTVGDAYRLFKKKMT